MRKFGLVQWICGMDMEDMEEVVCNVPVHDSSDT